MDEQIGNSTTGLQQKIDSAGELQSVVRTMKSMAASSIGQYETSIRALDDYYNTVQMALSACTLKSSPYSEQTTGAIGTFVFGSDQGLVGPFNELMLGFVSHTLDPLPDQKTLWAVGERIQSRLAESERGPMESFALPDSIDAITPLIDQILEKIETLRAQDDTLQIYLFYHQRDSGASYVPVSQRLLPLDKEWLENLRGKTWPGKQIPEVVHDKTQAMLAFVREYLFVSIFRACAQSLASENASRLAAMQRAEKNIDELLDDLNRSFHRLRQSKIDEELFDVISGFDALKNK